MQSKHLPGNKHVSFYVIIEFFLRNLGNKDLGLRASALSFTFFLALFPTVIFFFTVIAYLPIKYSHDEILFFIAEIIPQNVFFTINDTLEDILKNQRGGLLSLGFFSAIYFTTNGFHDLMNSLNRYLNQKETRSFFKQRMVATFLAVFVSVLIVASVTMVTAVNFVINYLDNIKYFPSRSIPYLINLFNYLIVGFIILSVIGAIYYFAPVKNRKWRFFSPGSIFATIVTLITTFGFSEYVNHFNSYNKVYGSIGVLIVIMMLIYINTYILLVGFELNVAIDLALDQENKNLKRRKSGNSITYLQNLSLDEKLVEK